ncbi:MAG: hypothetical protein PUF77_02685 [Clostridiales bacterium]|nr:hypothetical protein [Clostridiales bacterium]
MGTKKDRIQALVYTSNAGHTREYAKLLGEAAKLPVYELSEAEKELPSGSGVFYLGWIMAGQIKGLKAAAKKYKVYAVAGVGMARTGTQLADLRKTNGIAPTIPVFSIQGGFEMDKLKGMYRLMMITMKKTVAKGLKEKANRTPEEEENLRLLEVGGDLVDKANLEEILSWMDQAQE